MKYSSTAIKELNARYGKILRKCALLNAAILIATTIATPASADLFTINTEQDANLGKVTYENYNAQTGDDNTVLFVQGVTATVGEESLFQNNKADIGGAIAVSSAENSVIKIGSGTKFIGNEAGFDGGAIGNYGGAIIADNVSFSNNKAQLNAASDTQQIGGGAMSLGSESNTKITKSTFTENESGFDGGAIGTRHPNDGSQATSELTISGSSFTSNKANGYVSGGKTLGGNGGAIYNSFYKNASVSDTTF